MNSAVTKADGWDYLISSGFSCKAARFAFETAPKAFIAQVGMNEKGIAFHIHKWRIGDLEHFASKYKND